MHPWVFIPKKLVKTFNKNFASPPSSAADAMPHPLITALDDVVPWEYPWNRTEVAYVATDPASAE